MSTLRKQEIRSKKRKKNGSNYSKKIGHPLVSLLFMAARAPLWAMRWLFDMARKSPQKSLIFAGISSVILLIGMGITAFHKMESSRLPANLFIHSESDTLSERINLIAWQTLQESKRSNTSRSQFMQNLAQRLTGLEELDDFNLRVDLSRNLQISAAAQTPAFIAEVDDGSRWIVSQRLIVMGPVPTNQSDSKLILVKLPEAKMTQKMHLGKADSGRRFQISGANMPWLHRQLKVVAAQKTYFVDNRIQLESLTWRSTSGLAAVFSSKINSSANAAATPTSLTAVFGDNDISDKLEKLKLLTKDFAAKNIFPEHVDFSFSDRALVRMRLSESSTSVTF